MSRRALCSFGATLPRGVARKMSALPQEGSCSHWCFIAAGVALSYWHGAQSMPAVCSLPGTRRKYCSASDNAGSRWRRFVVISANRGACGSVDGQAKPRGCEGQKTRGPQSACSRFDWRRRQSFSTAQLTRGWSPFRGSTRPRLHGIGGRRAASECSLDAESSGTSRRDALLSVVRKDQKLQIVTNYGSFFRGFHIHTLHIY